MQPKSALVVAGLCGAFAAGHFLSVSSSEGRAEAAKNNESPHAAIEQLARVLVQVENRYVDPVDRDRLLLGAIKGMVAELDPHSEYFPPKEYGEFTSETTGGKVSVVQLP